MLKMDLIKYLKRQKEFSERTFGPMDSGEQRFDAIIDHIEKELAEVKQLPIDVFEWMDVVILAFDGALRAGWTPEQVASALKEKLRTNELRKWPDWRTADPGKAIEHIKEEHPTESEPPC